jgi:hypothetical protein
MAALKTRTPAKKGVMKASTKKAAAKKTPAKKVASKKTASSKVAGKQAAARKATPTKTPSNAAATKKPRIFAISFASVYPLYVQKAEKKGRTKQQVDEVIAWLTGYAGEGLQRVIDARVDFETFFTQAPRMNPNATLITGVVCGVRVEDLADPVMQKIRQLDKLVDELAQGKEMARILRQP